MIKKSAKGKFSKFNERIGNVSKETGAKSTVLKIKYLTTYANIRCSSKDYLDYELYNKNSKELKEYVTKKDLDKFYRIVSPYQHESEFEDRVKFYRNYKDFIKRDFFMKGSLEELGSFIERHEEFLVKPIVKSGEKVSKMSRKESGELNRFYEQLEKSGLFLEEIVDCPFELKIVTFSYEGKHEILYAYGIYGSGKERYVNIDHETGKFLETLEDVLNWDKAVKEVLKASRVSRHMHFVGWDVLVRDDGVEILDGNPRENFDIIQMLSKRGRKDIIRHCIDVINECEGTEYKI